MRLASLFAALFLTLLSLAPSLQDGQTSNAPSCCAVSCTAEVPASEEPGDPCDGMACNPMMICGTCAWLPTPGEALQVKELEGTAVQHPVVVQLASTAAVADFWQPPKKG